MDRIAAALAWGMLLAAAPENPRGQDVPVLVELFTSEGCSSCPAADALLARLARERPAGARVIALGEHVDYWDHLGWKDRFSSPVATRRQRSYARRLRSSAVYTPQLVVDGRIEALGSDERAARSAIAEAARERSGRIAARALPGPDPELALEAEWSAGVRAQVFLALVQDGATSRVARGENAGRTLEHVAIVRWLLAVGAGAGAFSGRVTLGAAELRGADRAVVFVQEGEGGPVHAAESIPLPRRW